MAELSLVDESLYLEVFADDYARYSAFCRLYNVSLMDGLSLLMDMACLGSAKEMDEASLNVVNFAFGNIGDRLPEEVAELNRRADCGEYLALIELAVAYADENSVQNMERAYRFASRAADTGNAEAVYLAGKIAYLSGRYDAAFSWFEMGASMKDTDCEFMLGVCYVLGQGCSVDLRKGEVLLTRAYKKNVGVDGFSELMEKIYQKAAGGE